MCCAAMEQLLNQFVEYVSEVIGQRITWAPHVPDGCRSIWLNPMCCLTLGLLSGTAATSPGQETGHQRSAVAIALPFGLRYDLEQ